MSEDKKNRDIPPRRRIEDDVIQSDPEDTGLANPPGDNDLRLPHEREEAVDPTEPTQGPRQVIEQAESDLERGLRDTERRGIPSDVPTPGTPPERSPGADVPPEGISRTRYGTHQKKGADEEDAEGGGPQAEEKDVPGSRGAP